MSNVNSIHNNSNNIQPSAGAQAPSKASTVSIKHTDNKTASVRVDQAAISNHSLLVSQALSVSDVRADKVASLQAAISSGTYNVSSSDVASSVIGALQS